MLKPAGNKYELVDDYMYKDTVVPAGYKTDGISYKLRLVALFINRFDPRYIEAAIVHDWLTDHGDWEKANKYFEEMLVDDWRKKLMVTGVKAYARLKGYV
jgi:pentatricopeptide repeat protein